jgi:ribosome-binding ATPase YchF (GTP1/OBG family)
MTTSPCRGRIDPVADAETVETELMLADLDSSNAASCRSARASGKDKATTVLPMMEAALELLQAGKPARILLKGSPPRICVSCRA